MSECASAHFIILAPQIYRARRPLGITGGADAVRCMPLLDRVNAASRNTTLPAP